MNFSKLLFLIGTVISVPLYIWQKLTNIDPVSGFFVEKDMTVLAFYAVLGATLIGMIVYSIWIMQDCSFSISNSKVLAVLSIGVGGTMLLGGILDLLNAFPASNIISFTASGEATTLQSGSMLLAGGIFVVSLLGAIVFLKLAIGYFKEDITNRGSYTFVFPILWALIICVKLFTNYPQIAGMPDRVLFLICLLSFTMFLVGQGRILSDVNMNRGVRFSCGCGFAAALSGFVLVAGELSTLKSGMSLPIYDVILTVFISAYCFCFSIGTRPLFNAKKTYTK